MSASSVVDAVRAGMPMQQPDRAHANTSASVSSTQGALGFNATSAKTQAQTAPQYLSESFMPTASGKGTFNPNRTVESGNKPTATTPTTTPVVKFTKSEAEGTLAACDFVMKRFEGDDTRPIIFRVKLINVDKANGITEEEQKSGKLSISSTIDYYNESDTVGCFHDRYNGSVEKGDYLLGRHTAYDNIMDALYKNINKSSTEGFCQSVQTGKNMKNPIIVNIFADLQHYYRNSCSDKDISGRYKAMPMRIMEYFEYEAVRIKAAIEAGRTTTLEPTTTTTLEPTTTTTLEPTTTKRTTLKPTTTKPTTSTKKTTHDNEDLIHTLNNSGYSKTEIAVGSVILSAVAVMSMIFGYEVAKVRSKQTATPTRDSEAGRTEVDLTDPDVAAAVADAIMQRDPSSLTRRGGGSLEPHTEFEMEDLITSPPPYGSLPPPYSLSPPEYSESAAEGVETRSIALSEQYISNIAEASGIEIQSEESYRQSRSQSIASQNESQNESQNVAQSSPQNDRRNSRQNRRQNSGQSARQNGASSQECESLMQNEARGTAQSHCETERARARARDAKAERNEGIETTQL